MIQLKEASKVYWWPQWNFNKKWSPERIFLQVVKDYVILCAPVTLWGFGILKTLSISFSKTTSTISIWKSSQSSNIIFALYFISVKDSIYLFSLLRVYIRNGWYRSTWLFFLPLFFTVAAVIIQTCQDASLYFKSTPVSFSWWSFQGILSKRLYTHIAKISCFLVVASINLDAFTSLSKTLIT